MAVPARQFARRCDGMRPLTGPAAALFGIPGLACEAWTKRMLAFQGPAQPSPALGDALNAGYTYLEVRCLGCDTHQTVALDIVRRPKATPIHELERVLALQGLFTDARLSVQAQPSSGASEDEDIGERSAIDVVAGGAVTDFSSVRVCKVRHEGDHAARCAPQTRATCWTVSSAPLAASAARISGTAC